MHTWIKVWIPGDATDGPPPSSNVPPTVKDDFDDTSHPPSWRYSLPRINGCRLIAAVKSVLEDLSYDEWGFCLQDSRRAGRATDRERSRRLEHLAVNNH